MHCNNTKRDGVILLYSSSFKIAQNMVAILFEFMIHNHVVGGSLPDFLRQQAGRNLALATERKIKVW